MGFSRSQQIALSICPRIFAAISLLSSILVAKLILQKTREKKGRRNGRHSTSEAKGGSARRQTRSVSRKTGSAKSTNIICNYVSLGTSIADILSSTAWFCSNWMIPSYQSASSTGGEDIRAFDYFGTQATCTLQGFFGNLCITSIIYNSCLAMYYFLAVGKGWNESKLLPLQKYMHGIALGTGIVSSLVGACLGMFNSVGWTCWISAYPPGCIESWRATLRGETANCIRGDNATLFLWAGFLGPLWLAICFSSVLMVKLYKTVLRTEKKSAVYDSAWSWTNGVSRTWHGTLDGKVEVQDNQLRQQQSWHGGGGRQKTQRMRLSESLVGYLRSTPKNTLPLSQPTSIPVISTTSNDHVSPSKSSSQDLESCSSSDPDCSEPTEKKAEPPMESRPLKSSPHISINGTSGRNASSKRLSNKRNFGDNPLEQNFQSSQKNGKLQKRCRRSSNPETCSNIPGAIRPTQMKRISDFLRHSVRFSFLENGRGGDGDGSNGSVAQSASTVDTAFRRSRKVSNQAIIFAGAPISSWFFPTLNSIVSTILLRQIFALTLLESIFIPTMGTWNLFLYLRPHYTRCRKKFQALTKIELIKMLLLGSGEEKIKERNREESRKQKKREHREKVKAHERITRNLQNRDEEAAGAGSRAKSKNVGRKNKKRRESRYGNNRKGARRINRDSSGVISSSWNGDSICSENLDDGSTYQCMSPQKRHLIKKWENNYNSYPGRHRFGVRNAQVKDSETLHQSKERDVPESPPCPGPAEIRQGSATLLASEGRHRCTRDINISTIEDEKRDMENNIVHPANRSTCSSSVSESDCDLGIGSTAKHVPKSYIGNRWDDSSSFVSSSVRASDSSSLSQVSPMPPRRCRFDNQSSHALSSVPSTLVYDTTITSVPSIIKSLPDAGDEQI